MKERNNVISANIRRLIKEEGITQKELANKINIQPSTLSDYLNLRSNPSHGVLQRMADYFGVKKSDIDTTYRTDNVIPIEDFVNIPILGTIACGDPITAEENINEYRSRSKNGLPSGELFYVSAQGSSMEPVISDGSLVLCRQQPDVETGEVAAVLVNGDTEATLKKVRKVKDRIMLEPINQDYEPYIIDSNNPARIIGKAIEVTNKL